MKRNILIVILFTIFSSYILAQDKYDRDDNDSYGHREKDQRKMVHFGVKAGANYSNVYDIKGSDFTADWKYGLAAGMYFGLPLGKYLGIRPEVLYSQRGYKSKGNVLGAGYQINHSADYIDIPLLLELKPSEFITVVVGPQYSYLISNKNSFSNSFLTAQQQQTFDNMNIRKNLMCFTAGLDINVYHLVIGGRFGCDLVQNNGDGTSSNPRYRNLWYQVTVGFRF